MCWTRNRYGTEACDADQLRADALESAVLEALVSLYADPDALREASAASRHHGEAEATRNQEEIAVLEAELAKTEAAVERYMLAFENGSVTEDMFGERVRELGAKAHTLRSRRSELVAAVAEAATNDGPPSNDAIAAIHDELRSVSANAPDALRKAVAQAFVHELQVRGKDRVEPRFACFPACPIFLARQSRAQGRPMTRFVQ